MDPGETTNTCHGTTQSHFLLFLIMYPRVSLIIDPKPFMEAPSLSLHIKPSVSVSTLVASDRNPIKIGMNQKGIVSHNYKVQR